MEDPSTVFLTVMVMLVVVVMPLAFSYNRLKEENELFRNNEEYERNKKMIKDTVISELAKLMKDHETKTYADQWKSSLCTYGDDNVGHNVKDRENIKQS